MLIAIRIRQFILVEELELRLEPGFNVLTGETGSGKSVLVDALGAVLGQRITSDVVRAGAEEAEVEALFDVSASASILGRLAAAGVECDGELVVRRVVHRSGRSRAYLNGRMCSARELVELGRELADVTSQHESVALVDPRTHLDYLDRFAGVEEHAPRAKGPTTAAIPLRAQVAEAHARLLELDSQIASLRARERDRAEREAFLRFQLDAIDAVAPEVGEHERLGEELERLKHGERLRGAASHVLAFLDGEDGGATDELGRLSGELGAAAGIDERLRGPADELAGAWARLREVSRDLGGYLDRLEVDPARVEEVQSRLYRLEKLMRAHGPQLDDVLATRERLARELEEFDAADARLPALTSERTAALEQASTVARALSRRRANAGVRLAEALEAELGELGMRGAVVRIAVTPRPVRDGEAEVDGAALGPAGIDRVELLLAPNPGSSPRALGQIASGGELSRVLLALRRVLGAEGGSAEGTHERRTGLVVLDEVDAGVGGETADRIGRAVASIARERQVLCITHLANIAAYADAHFVVTKSSDGGTTTSTARALEGPSRVAELARMLTGAKTGSTERAARDLLSAARRARTRPTKAA
ncbi:MAG: DNA repair protein RecN [Deltaproteobacteria bacterium]|nr:DNA repair protein RecN [Deltaproteobacteria bacterium]